MNPFEFIILFFSFIYTLALTHLLFAWTRMIRHRRELTISWPHLLWMLSAFCYLSANWISLWDFRAMATLSLAAIAGLFALVTINYFVCALVSPDFEGGETYDMKRFHAAEGPTYISAFLVLIVASLTINFLAGNELGVSNWLSENALVVTMLIPPIATLAVKRKWVQLLAPALELALGIAYAVIYYPVLTR